MKTIFIAQGQTSMAAVLHIESPVVRWLASADPCWPFAADAQRPGFDSKAARRLAMALLR